MGKMKEKLEEQEALEVIEAPEDITGEDIVDVVSEEQVDTDKLRYRAKVSIIYNNKCSLGKFILYRNSNIIINRILDMDIL